MLHRLVNFYTATLSHISISLNIILRTKIIYQSWNGFKPIFSIKTSFLHVTKDLVYEKNPYITDWISSKVFIFSVYMDVVLMHDFLYPSKY